LRSSVYNRDLDLSDSLMKATIAITMGDPCGIGPEVIVKALSDHTLYNVCRPFVIGHAGWMEQTAARFAPALSCRPITRRSDARFQAGVLEVLDIGGAEMTGVRHGDPRAATAAFSALTHATDMALSGEIDGITTAPIHKAQMKQVGFPAPGHTEFLAHRAGVTSFGMMMVGGGLKITLATIHLSLKEAARIQADAVLSAIRLTHRAMGSDFGMKAAHIAVAALNPHGGEEGLFGDEEQREIAPAVRKAQSEGITASGPYPADTLFYHLKRGRFDAAVALYHDQALIPIKLLAFGDAVNVTLGLPFVRTSVDHGTAYDIAGRGLADEGSLKAALLLAAQMAAHRKREVVQT